MLNITAGVTNTEYMLLYAACCWNCETKQNQNAIYFEGITRSAERDTKPNTMGKKEVESSPKTQIEILIMKLAKQLRCIARVRKSVKMIACSAMNRTGVKAISVDNFSGRKKTPD